MALMRGENVPKDAVVISQDEALTKQWELISEWIPAKDVWAIKYGCTVVSVCSLATAYYTNWFYRRKLKVGKIAYISSYMPVVMVPTLVSMVYHRQFITADILIQKQKCSVCMEIKSMAVQGITGIAYPLMLSPVTSFMIAARYNTCRIPMLDSETKKLIKFYFNLSKPLFKKIPLFILVNLIPAIGVTYLEYDNLYTVMRKLDDIEKKMNPQEMN